MDIEGEEDEVAEITKAHYIGALSKLPRSETKGEGSKTRVASKEETRRGGSGSGSGGRKSNQKCTIYKKVSPKKEKMKLCDWFGKF